MGFAALLAGWTAMLAAGPGPAVAAPAPPPGLAERRVMVMGTTFDVTVRLPRERALAAAEEAIAEIGRVEDLLTTWREGGPLSRVNAAPEGRRVPLEPELFDLLAKVFRWSERTGGVFDPTVLPLVRAWDLRGEGRLVSPAQIDAALRATGVRRFRLDGAGRTIERLNDFAGIDEGAWGKGYALDRAAERLRAAGAGDALLDLGGQVLALGADSGGRPWTVSVAHARERGRPVARIALPAGFSLSTSGNSERGLRVAGRMVGHLLDPRTGLPARDFGSASVIAPSGLAADVLSTAFFVLGPEEGLALSDRLRREGVPNEVLFLIDRGKRLEARASSGVSSFFLWADADAVAGLTKPDP